jgi:MFS family permease
MTADTLTAAVLPKPPSMHPLIVAATIGNLFEWFDFVVYGVAATLAEVFFPAGNPTVSLLVTFGAFGLAYIVRPLGAIVVGSCTDRAGRKVAQDSCPKPVCQQTSRGNDRNGNDLPLID